MTTTWKAQLVFGLLALTSADAQEKAAAPESLKIGSVTVRGSIRTRLEAWDWFPAEADNKYAFSGNLFRIGFSQNLKSMDWMLEFAVPFQLGLPTTAIAPGAQGQLGLGPFYYVANQRQQNTGGFFPKQAFIRFKELGGVKGQSLRIGRFEFNDGTEMIPKNPTLAALKNNRISQRLIGSFGWTHVGRSFDGLHYSLDAHGGNLTLIGAMPTRGVFQNDGWGWNNTAFGYAAYTRPYGKGSHAAESRVFGIYYDDWRSVLKTDNRSAAARAADTGSIRLFTFGGHSLHAFTTNSGTFDLLFWGAAQTGSWGSLTQAATAINIEAGYQPKILPALKPWFRAGFYNGSGDGDPTDSRHGTFFQILPTPRPFARFPFFNLMNNRDVFGIASIRPSPRWTISSEFHHLLLASRNDLWYSGGGVFQPWTFGYAGRPSNGEQKLGNLYDISVDWAARHDLGFTGYCGYTNAGAVTQRIYPLGNSAVFAYLEMTYRF